MPIPKKYHISFDPMGKSVDVLPGTNLLESAWLAGINLASTCGGNGTCGKCRIIVHKGETSPPKSEELKFLSKKELENGHRLACCTYAQGDLKIKIQKRALVSEVKLQVEARIGTVTVDPMIHAYDVKVDAASLEDPRADLDRVMDGLSDGHELQNLSADTAVSRLLSPFLRKHDWQITAYVRSGEIIGFAPPGAPPVGFAVDLGTTKIAAYLLDLTTGEELSSMGAVNPQTIHGDDVMSRLRYAIRHPGTSESSSPELSTMISEILTEMLDELTQSAGVLPLQVADACIVGNTAMVHLMLNLPVLQLSTAPYVAATNRAVDIKARDLGILTTAPGAYVNVLPGIGGFVGGDHVAMILATDIDQENGVTLGADIGTNTEIVLRRPDLPHLVTASCPSGPAFEGAHVTDGMRAAKGAIESVRITENGVEYRTIGGAPPIGLCGSGIIDAIAEMYRWDLIDERGRLCKKSRRIRNGEKGWEFQLVKNSEIHEGGRIVITQKDVDEIQLAKGAIRAGIEALLEETGTSPDMVTEVIIAGAFGSYINLISTIDIGLLPNFPNARYRQVGNAAGVGAKKALVSCKERKRADAIAANARYLELTTFHGFNRKFASGMMFSKE